MAAAGAGRALARLGATAAAAAAASSEVVAETRAAEPRDAPLVFDGSASWHLLDAADIDEASALVGAAAGQDVANRALGLAKKMATKPEVQRAFASELGIETGTIEEASSQDMLRLIETLRMENDTLQASNAATRAALDERRRFDEHVQIQRELLGDESVITLDDDELAEDDDTKDDEEDDATTVALVEATEVGDTSGDAQLAADIAAEDKRRFDALKDQELADEIFAKHIAGIEDDDGLKKPEKEDPEKTDDDDTSFMEIAMALAGIILVVAITRKLTPGLGRKALALGAAAVAAICATTKTTFS